MTENRRQFVRFPFRTGGRLQLPGCEIPVEVLDLSLKGALVAPAGDFFIAVGSNGSLHFRLGPDDVVIRMEITVVHSAGSRYGLACREIDLDSVTHLRRLVELNIGDDSTLQRELRALTGSAQG